MLICFRDLNILEKVVEFEDPRDAVLAASMIKDVWAKITNEPVSLGYGHTLGFTLPFDESSLEEAEEWAEKEYERLIKCDQCNEVLSKQIYAHDLNDDEKFCSERCAEKNYNSMLTEEE